MNKTSKRLFTIALALLILSIMVAVFGVKYEISKIPAEQRAKMADFDWVGAEWFFLSVFIDLIAFILAIVAFASWVNHRRARSAYHKLIKK